MRSWRISQREVCVALILLLQVGCNAPTARMTEQITPQPILPKDMPPATPSPAADLLPDPSTDPETALRYTDLPAGLGSVGWFGTVSVLPAWHGQGTGYL